MKKNPETSRLRDWLMQRNLPADNQTILKMMQAIQNNRHSQAATQKEISDGILRNSISELLS